LYLVRLYNSVLVAGFSCFPKNGIEGLPENSSSKFIKKRIEGLAAKEIIGIYRADSKLPAGFGHCR
jgi:hypothetical protein